MALRTTPGREPFEHRPRDTTGPLPSGPFAVDSVVAGRTAVLSLSGRVDLTALPNCRRAVDTLLRAGVVEITVDLRVARFDDESIALLALMRRYALRHGARLLLTDIPPHIEQVLRRTGVSWLYHDDTAAASAPPEPPLAGTA